MRLLPKCSSCSILHFYNQSLEFEIQILNSLLDLHASRVTTPFNLRKTKLLILSLQTVPVLSQSHQCSPKTRNFTHGLILPSLHSPSVTTTCQEVALKRVNLLPRSPTVNVWVMNLLKIWTFNAYEFLQFLWFASPILGSGGEWIRTQSSSGEQSSIWRARRGRREVGRDLGRCSSSKSKGYSMRNLNEKGSSFLE